MLPSFSSLYTNTLSYYVLVSPLGIKSAFRLFSLTIFIAESYGKRSVNAPRKKDDDPLDVYSLNVAIH